MINKWTDNQQITHHGDIITSKDGIDVIECSFCGYKHIIPFADEKNTEEFYSDKFYTEEKDNYISNHQKDQDWWLIEHNEKYDLFEEILKDSKRKKILDIGSGPGFFLKAGVDRGWKPLGVEPGIAAFKFSVQELNLNVFNDYFCRETYKKYGLFDVIHLNNVLEHINNPLDILKMAREILLPGGLVCITSPNDFNTLQEIAVKHLKKDQWWVSPTHHVNYFNMESLGALLTKSGFTLISKSASYPLELFILMGEDYVRDKVIGRNIHEKRMKLEKIFSFSNNHLLKKKLYEGFAKMGIGREITLIASES